MSFPRYGHEHTRGMFQHPDPGPDVKLRPTRFKSDVEPIPPPSRFTATSGAPDALVAVPEFSDRRWYPIEGFIAERHK